MGGGGGEEEGGGGGGGGGQRKRNEIGFSLVGGPEGRQMCMQAVGRGLIDLIEGKGNKRDGWQSGKKGRGLGTR